MSAPALTAAIVLLGVLAPFLLFPDILPPTSWRTDAIAALTVLASGLGIWLIRPWKWPAVALVVFVVALVVSWARAWVPSDEMTSLRHLSGVGFGILAMGVTAAWAHTHGRLMTAARTVVAGALVVVLVGWLGAAVNPIKLRPAAEQTPDAAGVSAPAVPLKLPGLSLDGLVNSNALGGTALLVLPLCLGLLAAGHHAGRRQRPTVALAATAATVATVVIAITLSRSAWLAALLTLVIVLVRRAGPFRWWRPLAAVLFATMGAAWLVQATAPVFVAKARAAVEESLHGRVMIWQDGLEHVRHSPWLGSGINRIHSGTRAYPEFRITHFHNMALQVTIDAGVVGLLGYVWFFGWMIVRADRTARRGGMAGRIAAGAGVSLVAVHLFGLADAIALGAKVGLFQWLSAGLILAAAHLPPPLHSTTTPEE